MRIQTDIITIRMSVGTLCSRTASKLKTVKQLVFVFCRRPTDEFKTL